MALTKKIREALGWRFHQLNKRVTLECAKLHRRRLRHSIFIGITGSAGKTTTKDLVLAILESQGGATGNTASLNYLHDLAKVVLATKSRDRYAVVEIAATEPGSLDPKISLVSPQIGVLTVVQRDHIKNFDTVADIAREKGKLILAIPPDGTVVLNMDDPLVREVGEQARARRIWFGRAADADIQLVSVTSSFPEPLTLIIRYHGSEYRCITGLHGEHMAVPVLAAIGVGLAAGVPIEQCITSLKSATTTSGRMQIVECEDGVTFLRDDYKAPHWSFSATMEYMRSARAERKVAVIGTLSDYSLSASKLYPKVARQALDVVDLAVFVGPHALRALKARTDADATRLVGFTAIEDANEFLRGELRKGDLVLLKGSNRADHLVRVMLSRKQAVGCWVGRCRYNRFCDDCEKLAVERRDAVVGVSDCQGVVSSGSVGSAVGALHTSETAWLVVGVGNFGSEYEGTPHNVGAEVADKIAEEKGLSWHSAPEGALCSMPFADSKVFIFKAATLVNRCGPEVEKVRRRLSVPLEHVIVVHDDADLPLGEAKLKFRGSDGGHRGLRSVFAASQCEGFMSRVRVGVRNAHDSEERARQFVLRHFDDKDAMSLKAGVEKAARLVDVVLSEKEGKSEAASKHAMKA